MIYINSKEQLILESFLDNLAEEMSNAGCNDWDFPSDWSLGDRQTFVKEYLAYSGNPEAYNPERPLLTNRQALAMLRIRMSQRNHDYKIMVPNPNDAWVKNYLTNEDEYTTFIDTFKDRTEPVVINFGFTSIGVCKKVYDLEGNILADVTDYDSW